MSKLAIMLFLSMFQVIGFLPIASSQTAQGPSQPQSTQPSTVSQDDVIRVSTEPGDLSIRGAINMGTPNGVP